MVSEDSQRSRCSDQALACRSRVTLEAVTLSTNHMDSIQPVRGTGPFLLIVRTGWIVTAHAGTLNEGCDTNEYHRILGVSSI